MTREEAIAYGKMWLEVNEDAKDSGTYNFFKISIKALEQEITIKNDMKGTGARSDIGYCKSLIDNNDEKPGKIDQTAARLTNLTFMSHFLTTEELLGLRKIITKELLTRPDYMMRLNKDHVKFYIHNTPAIDVADFCKKYGYEMHIGDSGIWIQKSEE